MITLITGLPGASKTLITIQRIKQLSEQENRPVFYKPKEHKDDWGIELTPEGEKVLGWQKLKDPECWYECPANSIVLIDEAQKQFKPRSTGSEVPKFESELETHRHTGLDLFLITQHPMFVSTHVRRLAERHYHHVRVFGTQRSTVHEFSGVRTDPEKNRVDSVRHEHSFPAEIFKLYKSAEVHTHKRNIPMRVWMVAAAPLVLIALGYVAWDQLTGSGSTIAQVQEAAPEQISASAAPVATPAGQQYLSPAAYLAAASPRVDGLPFTAPKYDEIQKPAVAPKPASCIQSASKGCRCFTQQSTPLNVPDDLCRQIVQGGWFDDTLKADKPPIMQTDMSVQPGAAQIKPMMTDPAGQAPPSGV